MRVKINDLCFYGDKSSSKYHSSKRLEWYRGPETTSGENQLVFFTDFCLPMVEYEAYKDTFNVAWILEPYAITPFAYQYAAQNAERFDLILSHHVDFVEKVPNAKYYRNQMSWVDEKDFGVYDKSKNLSIVASAKQTTAGHQLRHFIVSQYKDILDIYGSGYNPIQHKIDALRDYRFAVCVENCSVDLYYTEKLLDALLTGTIPLYYGPPSIGKIFNPDGILSFHSEQDLAFYVKMITEDPEGLYQDLLPHVKENFEIAKDNLVAEDWIFDNIALPTQAV